MGQQSQHDTKKGRILLIATIFLLIVAMVIGLGFIWNLQGKSKFVGTWESCGFEEFGDDNEGITEMKGIMLTLYPDNTYLLTMNNDDEFSGKWGMHLGLKNKSGYINIEENLSGTIEISEDRNTLHLLYNDHDYENYVITFDFQNVITFRRVN